MKTITILLPIFNETESFPLLKENIQQVIKDNSNYEWIILMINDGSTDNSLEKMKNLCQEDHHFHYIEIMVRRLLLWQALIMPLEMQLL